MSGRDVKQVAAFAHGGNDVEPSQSGMTLRDYFAGQWIAAGHHASLTASEAAEQAYELADAMIAERNK